MIMTGKLWQVNIDNWCIADTCDVDGPLSLFSIVRRHVDDQRTVYDQRRQLVAEPPAQNRLICWTNNVELAQTTASKWCCVWETDTVQLLLITFDEDV